MPLAASHEAIGAVSEAIRSQLMLRTATLVTVGRPAAAESGTETKLNLFLFHLEFDPHLRNQSLDPGQPAPLWLSLRYLLTAYDLSNDSDSVAAHRLLSRGLAALQEMNILRPSEPALQDNPEPLKLSFEQNDMETMSKLLQGNEEKFRIAAAFQVRPVLIAPDVPPAYAPPVLTVGPPGNEGVVVLPGLGPRLLVMTPTSFDPGARLELAGDGIGGHIDTVWLGPLPLPVVAAREGSVQAMVPAEPTISAGHWPVRVSQRLPSGRVQTSNPLAGTLRPVITLATVGALSASGPNLSGDVTLTGLRLGGMEDLVFVAFYRDGIVALNLEMSGTAAQTSLVASVPGTRALPPGRYFLILRVNGAQARFTPEIDWTT